MCECMCMCVCVCVCVLLCVKFTYCKARGSTPGSSYFSLVFIKNLKLYKSKHKKQMLLFVLYCPGPLAVIIKVNTFITYVSIRLYFV